MSVVELRQVTKRFGQLVAVNTVSLSVGRGEIVSLLGPSGCGKTTTLRLIAGFETPDTGAIFVSGKDVSGRKPYERNIGLLFQDYALFPHMTVAQNVTYGLRRRRTNKKEIGQRLHRMLDLVKLTGYEERRPSQLSGGQQQRVALARALATEPEVILLDEPLSALDAKLRQQLRVELKEILGAVGTTAIVVTHDQEEAMSLATRVMVMNEGCIVQQGSPSEIYERPATKFVAEFVGRSNWFEGVLQGAAGTPTRIVRTAKDLNLIVPDVSFEAGSQVGACVRPERVRIGDQLSTANGARPDINRLRGKVFDVAYLGADVHMLVDLDVGFRILAIEKNAGRSVVKSGDIVSASFEPGDCIVVPSPCAGV